MTDNQDLTQEVLVWLRTLADNKPLPPQDFLRQTEDLKKRALTAAQSGALRSTKTDMLFDPNLAIAEEALDASADDLRERLWQMVYQGEVSSEALDKELATLAQTILPKPGATAAANCPTCLICTACVSCINCVSCAVCIVTGIAAALTAGFTATVATAASTAAAK